MMIKHFFTSQLFRNYSLLIFVIVFVFLIPLLPQKWHYTLFDIFLTLVYISASTTVEKYRKTFLITAVILMTLLWIPLSESFPYLDIISKLLAIVFFVLVVVSFIFMISRAKVVDTKVILESINGYLLLGIMFSLIIAVIMFYNPDAFKFPEGMLSHGGGVDNFNNYLYFSLVTMSTLGYGDIVPILPYSRSLATFMSVGGQLYIAIIIAMLVGKFASQKSE